MKVVFFATDRLSHERFKAIADAVRERGDEPHVVRQFTFATHAVASDSAGSDFIIAGVTGTEHECLVGLDVLSYAVKTCSRAAIGVYMDQGGYATIFRRHTYPSLYRHRIRFAVFAGTQNKFPHGHELHSVGGSRHFVDAAVFSRERARQLATDLTEVAQRKVIAV